MNRDLFWLTDEQFRRIEPHLPTDTRGKARVDDRRVISGIVPDRSGVTAIMHLA
jgi:transposase